MHSLVKVPHIGLLYVLVFKITITITKKNFIFARIKFIEKISRQVFMTVLLIVNYSFFFVYCCKMNIYLISLPCEIFIIEKCEIWLKKWDVSCFFSCMFIFAQVSILSTAFTAVLTLLSGFHLHSGQSRPILLFVYLLEVTSDSITQSSATKD